MNRNILLIFINFFFYINIYSQVVINEYSASNLRDFQDNHGKYEDWIELYNNSSQVVDIGGWYLSDKESKPKKWKIPTGTKINPHDFLLFWVSGRDEVIDGQYHTNFKFTQTNGDEYAVLANKSGAIVEKYALTLTSLSHSICKPTDGSGQMMVCTDPSPAASNNGRQMYKSYTPKPNLLKTAGFYKDSVSISIEAPQGDFKVRYTKDGSIPTKESQIFENKITLKKSAIIKIRCFSDDQGILPGQIDFGTYFINEIPSTLPVFSVSGAGDVVELAEGHRELNPVASVEVFDPQGNIIGRSFGELDSHGQDSWVNPQRSLDWISRDEMGYDSGIRQKLFNYSERDEYQRLIFRASGDDNYPAVEDEAHKGSTHIRDEYVHTLVQNAGMHLDVRAVERCLLFLNGEYWGVYSIREKPDDHDYTDFRYKQDKYDLQFLKTWGWNWAEYGEDKAMKDWETFRKYILNSDVSQDDVYKNIEDQLDIVSLMDYMITNLSVVSSDWMNYNTGWWRGLNPEGEHKKWGYIMWDNDATFNYYINYSGVPDRSPNAKACDINEISNYMDIFFPPDTSEVIYPKDSVFWEGEWYYWGPDTVQVYPDLGKHEKIFIKLLENNSEFRNLYFSRYADMTNTAFSCSNMLHVLDSLVSIIRPEMPRHITRWGRSLEEWEENITTLREFIALRCERIDDGLAECYNLSGPYNLTLMTEPENTGIIKLNTLIHSDLPWSGKYFGDMKNKIEIQAEGSNKFLYWKSKKGNITIQNPTNTITEIDIKNQDTLVAVFEKSNMTDDLSSNSIVIHPNPANDIIYLSVSEAGQSQKKYQILNPDGKIVESGMISFNIESSTLNIQNLKAGYYLIKILDDKINYTGKLVKID